MINKLLEAYNIIKNFLIIGNFQTSRQMAKENIKCIKKNNSLILSRFDIEINLKKEFYFIRAIKLLNRLYKTTNCKFCRSNSGELIAIINSVVYNLSSYEDIVLLSEIFLDFNYDIFLPAKSIVMDIGMNNADTSLYFASKENIESVYGYEPFTSTHKKAIKNLNLNHSLSAKILTNNYGLSDRHMIMECDYSSDNTAGAGLFGILGKKKDIVKEKIVVHSVIDEVVKVKKHFPNHKLIMKVDCEGSEFEIIESLSEKKMLGQVDIILLEWHIKQPSVIINTLLKTGFTVLNKNNLNSRQGLLYAFKI